MSFFYIFLAMLCFIIISSLLVLFYNERRKDKPEKKEDNVMAKPEKKGRLRDDKGRFVKSK